MMIPLSISVDPWALTLISVSVVFSALIILFILYSFSGAIFTGKFKRAPKPKKGNADAETAAAIAMALESYLSDDGAPAAIALALHLYMSESVHDVEPGFITIKPSPASGWNNKSLTFRKKVK